MQLLAALPLLLSPPQELQIAVDPEHPEVVQYSGGRAMPDHYPSPRHRGHFPEGLFLPVGFGVASASHPSSATSLDLGLEASVVVFPIGPGNWVGAYTDLYHETKNELTRASLGLEAGWAFIGVDGGVVMQSSDRGTHWGGVVRPMLTMTFITFFTRWGWLKDDERFLEIGALFKFPIHLSELD